MLGVSTQRYIQFGQDLLSKQHSDVVAFRNKDWITSDYASLSDRYWDVKTNEIITKPSPTLQKTFDHIQSGVNEKLAMSDNLNQKNLLRFYKPKAFKEVEVSQFDYSKRATISRLKKQNVVLGKSSTSLFAKNGNQSTLSKYLTDAPEANDEKTDSTRLLPRNADDWSQIE